MENQTEKKIENQLEADGIRGYIGLGVYGFYMETTKPLGTVDRVAVKGT